MKKSRLFQRIKNVFLPLFRAGLICGLVNVAVYVALLVGNSGMFQVRIEAELLVLPLYYLLPPILYIFLEEYNDPKKERITGRYQKKPGFLKAVADSALSVDFWVTVLPLLAFLLIFDPGNVLILLCPISLKKKIVFRYLFAILYYILPQTLQLLLVEGSLRRDWYRHWKMNSFRKEGELAQMTPLPKGRLVFNIFVLVFGSAAIEIFFLLLLGLLYSILLLLIKEGLLILWLLASVVPLFLTIRWWRVYQKKIFTKKRLLEISKAKAYSFTWKAKTFHGSFFCPCIDEVRVETEREIHIGVFLPVHSTASILYLFPDGHYAFEKRFFWWWIFYPKHKLSLETTESVGEKPVKRYLILTKDPKQIRVGDEDLSAPVFCGHTVGGLILETPDSFCNYFDRLGRLF